MTSVGGDLRISVNAASADRANVTAAPSWLAVVLIFEVNIRSSRTAKIIFTLRAGPHPRVFHFCSRGPPARALLAVALARAAGAAPLAQTLAALIPRDFPLGVRPARIFSLRSEEHTSELQ